MQLEFSEIINADQFENLVAAYFEDIRNVGKENPQISDVRVSSPGKGADGGKDVLVTFTINDTIATYYKKWVVQCKFYNRAVNPSDLKDDSIPTLIHGYGANGYLLVCRENASQKLVELFGRLEAACMFSYKYQVWNGDKFRGRIVESSTSLIQTYFPKYYSFIHQPFKK